MWDVSLYYDRKWDLIVIPDQKKCEWHNCGGIKVYKNSRNEEIALCFIDKEAFVVIDTKTNKLWTLKDFENDALKNGTDSIMVKQDSFKSYNNDLIYQTISFIDDFNYVLAYENMIVDLDLNIEEINFGDLFKDSTWWTESVRKNKFKKIVQ